VKDEFLIFSDMHYYSNINKSTTLPNGRTSWFQMQLDITNQIFNYAREHNIEVIIFNGDLFEEKNRLSQSIYNSVWDTFKEVSREFYIIFNTGNHDLYNLKRDSSLKPFSDIVTVVTFPQDFTFEYNTFVRVIPFGLVNGESLKLPNEKYTNRFLFTHEDISGLKWGAWDKAFLSSSPLKKEIFGDWDRVFNGHIHCPQEVKNIVNIGSCMRHDFGEADDVKRIVHYKEGEIKSIPIECPKFITFDGINDKIKSLIQKDDYNFYRINIDSSVLDDDIFRKFNVSVGTIVSREREVRLKEVSSDRDVLREYLSINEDTTLDKDKLFEIGVELQND
jgi:DNA repair exonuclease SbcCD nuclease subunit